MGINTKFAGVKQFAQQAQLNLMTAHDTIIESRVVQAHHANCHRQPGKLHSPGDLVYLSTKNLSLPKGRAKKLVPRYIGLYKVVEVHTNTSTVTLERLPELVAWCIHPMFHVGLIRAHMPNDDGRFPHCDTKLCYNFGSTDKPEWFIDEILAH